MLNREKIRLMCDLAMYEKHNRDGIFKVFSNYRFNYISWEMISSFFRYTLCALLMVAVYLIFNIEEIFYNINIIGISALLQKAARFYLAGLLLYLLITYCVCRGRYKKAADGMGEYMTKLRRLGRRFNNIGRMR